MQYCFLISDIICIQECDHHQWFIQQLSAMGYTSHFAQRGQRLLHNYKQDGCLIAYRNTKFQLFPSTVSGPHIIDLDDLACIQSTPPNVGQQIRYLRHNIAIAVFLQPLQQTDVGLEPINCSPLLVTNVHLFWNPIFSDVKLKQMVYIMKRIQICCQEMKQWLHTQTEIDGLTDLLQQLQLTGTAHIELSPSSISSISSFFPILLVGDFNSTPLSEVYSFITTGLHSNQHENDRYTHTRLIVDEDLSRLAKMLRSIGIDVSICIKRKNPFKHCVLT